MFGPSEHAEIDFRIFRHEQGLVKVETTLKHLRSPDTEAKKHLRIALFWSSYLAGTGTRCLDDNRKQSYHIIARCLYTISDITTAYGRYVPKELLLEVKYFSYRRKHLLIL